MTDFKLEYKSIVKTFLVLAFFICTAGIIFNLISVIEYSKMSILKTVTYSILLACTIFICVIIVSLLFFSKYTIKNNFVVLWLGFIRFKSPIENIVSITHFKKTNSLVVYFNNAEYSVIMIKREFFESFIDSLTKQNPKIIIDVSSVKENI